MTPEEYVKWIDDQIEMSKQLKKGFTPNTRGHDRACDGIAIFEEVKKHFLKLTPPPTTLS